MIRKITAQSVEIVTKDKKDGSGTYQQQVITDTAGTKYFLKHGKYDKPEKSGPVSLYEYQEEYQGKMYTKHRALTPIEIEIFDRLDKVELSKTTGGVFGADADPGFDPDEM